MTLKNGKRDKIENDNKEKEGKWIKKKGARK